MGEFYRRLPSVAVPATICPSALDAESPRISGGFCVHAVDLVAFWWQTPLISLAEGRIQGVGGLALHAHRDVRVQIERYRDAGMAEALLHDLGMHALGEHEGGRGVA